MGAGHAPKIMSDDVLLAQCQVNHVPHCMNQCSVDFLNSMDTERWHDEAVLRNAPQPAAVLSCKCNRHQTTVTCSLERINQIRRLSTRADRESHIVCLAQKPELINKDPGEIEIVADGRHRRNV